MATANGKEKSYKRGIPTWVHVIISLTLFTAGTAVAVATYLIAYGVFYVSFMIGMFTFMYDSAFGVSSPVFGPGTGEMISTLIWVGIAIVLFLIVMAFSPAVIHLCWLGCRKYKEKEKKMDELFADPDEQSLIPLHSRTI